MFYEDAEASSRAENKPKVTAKLFLKVTELALLSTSHCLLSLQFLSLTLNPHQFLGPKRGLQIGGGDGGVESRE